MLMPIGVEIIKLIQSLSSPFTDRLFEIITMTAEEYFLVVVLAFIYWCIDKKAGQFIGACYLINMMCNGMIKNLTDFSRPIMV